jgi:hypothetical protein
MRRPLIELQTPLRPAPPPSVQQGRRCGRRRRRSRDAAPPPPAHWARVPNLLRLSQALLPLTQPQQKRQHLTHLQQLADLTLTQQAGRVLTQRQQICEIATCPPHATAGGGPARSKRRSGAGGRDSRPSGGGGPGSGGVTRHPFQPTLRPAPPAAHWAKFPNLTRLRQRRECLTQTQQKAQHLTHLQQARWPDADATGWAGSDAQATDFQNLDVSTGGDRQLD